MSAALVTGGSGEIGRAIALRLAADGAAVCVAGRRAEPLQETVAAVEAAGGRAVPAAGCDVTDPDAVEAAVEAAEAALGPLTIAVNNAGGALFMSPLEDVRAAGMRKVTALNLEAPLIVARAVGGRMLERGAGSIVNVTSIAGLRHVPGLAHYGAAKAGLASLTRSLAREWAPRGVRVNAVSPGFVATAGWRGYEGHPGFEAATAVELPLGRWVTPEEVADAVAFLAAAPSITGALLAVDGGMSA